MQVKNISKEKKKETQKIFVMMKYHADFHENFFYDWKP